MSALTGKQVAGFELLDELGRGAMGVVYKARQLSLDRLVAVKFLPKRLASDQKKVQRFIREARAAGKLSHPNIVAAYDVGQAGGVYYIAMEFVDGQSAYKMLQHRGRLMEDEVIDIGIQAANGLMAAHAAGILHRDIKPDNFLMDQAGNLKLADLGLARFEDDSGEQGHLTQDGTAMGTPHYMSPEAAKGNKVDARSDLYSLGASLFLLASTHTPYKGATSAAIMVSVISEQPRSLRELAPDLSAPLVEVIEKLMQKDPAKRYQSADEVVKALQKAKSAPRVPVSVTKQGAWKPATMPDRDGPAVTPAMFAILGGVVGVVVLFGIFWITRSTPPPPDDSKKPAVIAKPKDAANTSPDKKPEEKALPGKTREERVAEADARREARAEHSKLVREHDRRLREDPKALAEDWEALIRKYPEASFTDHARGQAAEARSVAEAHIRDWEVTKQKADQAFAAKNPKAAAEIYMGYIQRHPNAEQAKEARKIVAETRQKAIEWVKAQAETARTKAKEGDFDGAQAILDKLKADLSPKFYEETQVGAVAEDVRRMREELAAKAVQLKAADDKRLEDAHTKAEALVRTESPGFEFARAAQVFTTAARLLELPATKKTASDWAERYRRMGKAWDAVKKQAKDGIPGELKSLGRYNVPGKVTGTTDRGLTYASPKLPAGGQLVPWKDLTPQDALALAKIAGVSPLEMALLAYALGSPQAADLLNPAKFTDPVEQALARGAYERAGQGAKEKMAETALAQAQAAKKEDDPKAAAEAIAALGSGGPLADTAVAREHATEIAALKEWYNKAAAVDTTQGAGATPVPQRTTAETVAELKKLGWDTVEGLWVPDPKTKDLYKATNAKLTLNAVDAGGTLKFKLEPGAELSLYGRFAPSAVPPMLQGFLREGLGEIAPGYGVSVTGSGAKIYEPFKPPMGMGRRGGGFLRQGKFPVASNSDFKVRPMVHTLTIQVKGDTVSIDLDNQRRSFTRIRPNGTFVLELKGTAEIQMPLAKKL